MTQSLSPGKKAPKEFNVLIEIPAKSPPVKYEFDKESNLLFVDRFMSAPMFYPCDYGYIPKTLASDGDPIDVLVLSPQTLVHGCVIPARAVGMLDMSDEGGGDVKILAVPTKKVCPEMASIEGIEDIPKTTRQQIQYFFEHYKDLDVGKWVKVEQWHSRDVALKYITESIKNYPG